jgi:aromatic-L-amino-acid/L-tryptophan decarboxylase
MRELGSLEAAFGHQERYMLREGDISMPVDRTLEYSRPLRSMRLWMCLRVYGAAQYRHWIESGLANARALAELVRASDGFELLNEPMLSTVCFRHVPAGIEDLDEHNVRLAAAIAADGRVYLAAAVVDGLTCLRVCFVNFRTTADAIPLVLEVARALGDRLAAQGTTG